MQVQDTQQAALEMRLVELNRDECKVVLRKLKDRIRTEPVGKTQSEYFQILSQVHARLVYLDHQEMLKYYQHKKKPDEKR